MRRWIFFTIAILIGVAAGLVYGWFIQPLKYSNTSLDTLSIDYKTDYVLMVAEAYSQAGDLEAASKMLKLLGSDSPDQQIIDAITFGEKAGYSRSDIQSLEALKDLFTPATDASTNP